VTQPGVPRVSILFVCTGNICRSALADRLARTYLDDAPAIQVASAGTRALVGSGMDPASAEVLRALGGDPAGFTARRLDASSVASAQLVLGMTREHRRAALELDPRALSRAYTLREAADLLQVLDGAQLPGETFAERSAALVRAMAGARSRRSGSADDDVADPIGRPLAVHQAAGEAIAAAVDVVMRRFLALREAPVPS
jgi:protein-tyrosine phosphatase